MNMPIEDYERCLLLCAFPSSPAPPIVTYL